MWGYSFLVPHFPATVLSAMDSHINISLTRNTSSATLGDTDNWEAEAKQLQLEVSLGYRVKPCFKDMGTLLF